MYGEADKASATKTSKEQEDLEKTGDAITFSLAGAAVGAMASMLENEADLGYKDANAFGYTEQVKQTLASKDDDKKTQDNADQLGLLLKKITDLDLKTQDDCDYAFQLYSDALGFVKDSSVLTDDERSQIVTGLKALASASMLIYKDPKIVLDKIARLFISALNNPFFLNRNNLAHKGFSDTLNGALQNTFAQIFFDLGQNKIYLPKTGGQFIWTGKSFVNEGSVYFTAKSSSGLLVHFLKVPEQMSDPQLGAGTWLEQGSSVYEIGLGVEKNSLSCVKVSHLGRPVTKVLSSNNPQAAMSGFKAKSFWVSFSQGTLSIGQGDWGKGGFLKWQDPYPQTGTFYVGLSPIDGPVELTDCRVSLPVGKLDDKTIAGKTADEAAREAKLASKKAESGLSDADNQAVDQLTQMQNPLDADAFTDDSNPLAGDQLEAASEEMEYNPLEFGALQMAQYKRDEKEQGVVQQFYADKQAAQKQKDTVTAAANQAAQTRSKDAEQARSSRGQQERANAAGLSAVGMEYDQLKQGAGAVTSDVSNIKSELGVAKKRVSGDFGRNLATANVEQEEEGEEEESEESEGYVDAQDKIIDRALTTQRQEGLKAKRDQAQASAQAAKKEAEGKTAQVAEKLETAQLEAKKPSSADAASDAHTAASPSDTKPESTLQSDKSTDAQEFMRLQTKADDAASKSGDKTAGHNTADKSAPDKVREEDSTAAAEDQDTVEKAASPVAYEPADQSWKNRTLGVEGTLAVAQATKDASGEKKTHATLDKDLQVLKGKLEQDENNADLKQQVEEQQAKVDAAKKEADRAADIAKRLRYTDDPATVGRERDDLTATEKELAKLQASKLAKPSPEIDEQIADAQAKVEQEKESYYKKAEEALAPFASRASAIGAARMAADDAETELKKAMQEGNTEEIENLKQKIVAANQRAKNFAKYDDEDAKKVLRLDELQNKEKLTTAEQKELKKLDSEVPAIKDKYSGSLGKAKSMAKGAGLNLLQGFVMGVVSGSGSQSNPDEQEATATAEAQAQDKLQALGVATDLDRN
jgi:hypothetical protein